MPRTRAAQVTNARGPFQIVEREIAQPGPGKVRIRVQASGICHSDSLTKEGHWPGIQYPRVPGHEVAGIIDAVGSGVTGWSEGDRVGVGWQRSMNELFPLERAAEAYERMMSGKARFRVVLTTGA